MTKRRNNFSFEPVELTVESIHVDGQGLCHTETGRKVLVWGAYPGERVLVRPLKRAKGFTHAELLEVREPSPSRIEPQESHYLSCSPWQALHPDAEREYKIALAREVFRLRANYELPDSLELAQGARLTGYRNKMEFSFTTLEDGTLSLALNRRVVRRKVAVDGCVLARPELNEAARAICEALRSQGIKEEQLKTLVVRSTTFGRTAAALFTNDKQFSFDPSTVDVSHLNGFSVYYSDPALSASLPTRLLSQEGSDVLIEELTTPEGRAVKLRTGLLNFFQVNVEAFELALCDMAPHVGGTEIVEYFSGVGAISITLSSYIERALLSDIDVGGITHAKENITMNSLEERFEAVAESARRMRQEITAERIVVFDPPRSGIEPKVIARVLEALPPRIVYLSCNFKTQADDLRQLLPHFDVSFARLYNFFPRTPHIESLIVLERKR